MRPSALEAVTSPNPDEGTEKTETTPSEETHVGGLSNTRSPNTHNPQSQGVDEHTPAPNSSEHTTTPRHNRNSTPSMLDGHSTTPREPSTPFGQLTDGTQTAAKVVEEVVHGVKVVVDGAFAWAEKKVEELSAESDSTGPYTSQATCVPSDLDPIASGVLGPILSRNDTGDSKQEQTDGNGKDNTEEKDVKEIEEVKKDGSP
jgi:hypothetical protein